MTALAKYLERYAEPETQQLTGFPGHFQQGLVVPVYREHRDVAKRFCDFAATHQSTLLILVVNRPDSGTVEQILADKLWCQQFLAYQRFAPAQLRWTSCQDRLKLYALEQDSAVLVVDRALQGPAIPAQQGVGLARKIGADILCRLIREQKVLSPWIANTDADALLPAEYFSALTASSETSPAAIPAAIIYPYEHIFADSQAPVLATLLYEFYLHYYVAGLQYAGSPYGYHTLGSTITAHYRHYAQVRGFPKRAGAEDFYLLNKLAKTGAIESLQGPVIQLQARISDRVPFGTGPAVKSLTMAAEPLAMALYHPHCFCYLRLFLQSLLKLAELGPADIPQLPQHIADTAASLCADNGSGSVTPEHLLALCQSLQLQAALEHSLSHGKDAKTRLNHLRQWFDGFKTLKLVHRVRDQWLPSIDYRQWQQQFAESSSLLNPTLRTLIHRIEQASSAEFPLHR